MKIQYTGNVRVRVERIGHFEPDEIRDVPDEIGQELVMGKYFRAAEEMANNDSPQQDERDTSEQKDMTAHVPSAPAKGKRKKKKDTGVTEKKDTTAHEDMTAHVPPETPETGGNGA